MALLHIDLQEGFEDETVIIKVAGKEVFRKTNVRTKLQIGFADSFETTIEGGPMTVEIELPSKNQSKRIEVQGSKVVYLGVSVIEGKIEHRISNEQFGYL